MANKRIIPAHVVTRKLLESVWYPDHDPRTASAEYKRVHNHLVYELDEPCWICGIKQSQLPKKEYMETHHQHVEWALVNAIDPQKIIQDFPEMGDNNDQALRHWLDSEGNMLVLCEAHHRHKLVGIHSVTYPIWQAQRWQFNNINLIPEEPDN
jgi:hypothetical protein